MRMMNGNQNNVYLSGKGDDKNDGLLPVTAVRTFQRAKELLEGGEDGGYFTKGANILISSTLNVKTEDHDWSFGEGGTVTNLQSKETWKPIVKIYEEFDAGSDGAETGASVIVINNSVTFSNITMGHSDLNLLKYDHVRFLCIEADGTAEACFGEGAVIENIQGGSPDKEFLLIGDKTGGSGHRALLIFDGLVIQTCNIQSNYDLIRIGSDSELIIRNGLLQNNTFLSNVGYFIQCRGSFCMEGGKIQGNKILSHSLDSEIGLIDLTDGRGEIYGGIISDNYILASANYSTASVIFINGGSVILHGGTIQNNQTEGTA